MAYAHVCELGFRPIKCFDVSHVGIYTGITHILLVSVSASKSLQAWLFFSCVFLTVCPAHMAS